MIAIGVTLAMAAALVLSLQASETFSADAGLLVDEQRIDERVFPRQVLPPADRPDTGLALVSLDRLTQETQDELGVRKPDSTKIVREGDSNLITVTVSDTDPELAAQFANALAVNYVEFRRDEDRKTLSEALDQVEHDLAALPAASREGAAGDALRQQATRITALRSLQTGEARLVDPAEVPGGPDTSTAVSTGKNLVLAAILGLVGSIGLALLADRTDPRLKSLSELKEAFGMPLLGRVPPPRRGAQLSSPPGALPAKEREAYRLLRSRLRYFNVDHDVKLLLVTSPSTGDGKTSVARYLAGTAGEAGVRALLIEADLRRPVLAEKLGLPSMTPGLAEVLSGQVPIGTAVHSADSLGPNLDVVVGGTPPPNPTELLESGEAAALLQHVRGNYDLIVIDAPPITVVADAFPLVSLVDGVIAVGRVSHTGSDQAILLRQQLAELGAKVFGFVATGVKHADDADASYLTETKQPGAFDRILSS